MKTSKTMTFSKIKTGLLRHFQPDTLSKIYGLRKIKSIRIIKTMLLGKKYFVDSEEYEDLTDEGWRFGVSLLEISLEDFDGNIENLKETFVVGAKKGNSYIANFKNQTLIVEGHPIGLNDEKIKKSFYTTHARTTQVQQGQRTT